MKSLIRLFKAVPAFNPTVSYVDEEILNATIPHGFIFSPEVMGNYKKSNLLELAKIVSGEFGLSGHLANSTFHKSWEKVRDASLEQLALEQMIHYLTTYGFEHLSVYSPETIFVPAEKLEVPGIRENFRLFVISGLTTEQFSSRLSVLLESGIALSPETISDVVNVAKWLGVDEGYVTSQVKNKEVRVVLFEHLDLVPSNPVEFLRYCIFRVTRKTLLIKDRATYEALRGASKSLLLNLFTKYEQEHGLEGLASIFYRFRPLFLAMRSDGFRIKEIINRIRRMAPKYHRPMPKDLLNEVTAKISRGERVKPDDLDAALDSANTFRKIRLAYALQYRLGDAKAITYQVRNGKAWSEEWAGGTRDKSLIADTRDLVLLSLASSMNVSGIRIAYPDNVSYALPATEKKFTGNFPSGTTVEIDRALLFGIHWYDVNYRRIDLDLSMIELGRKYGWDGSYRNEGRSVLFSGDLTAAPLPRGASEFFYVGRNVDTGFLLTVNFFNCYENHDLDVPFQIVVASESRANFSRNRIVDPNKYLVTAKSSITAEVPQKILGYATGGKFVFSEMNMARGRTARVDQVTSWSREALRASMECHIPLRGVLENAGAILVPVGETCDLDLSPEGISKDSIISLLM